MIDNKINVCEFLHKLNCVRKWLSVTGGLVECRVSMKILEKILQFL